MEVINVCCASQPSPSGLSWFSRKLAGKGLWVAEHVTKGSLRLHLRAFSDHDSGFDFGWLERAEVVLRGAAQCRRHSDS